MNKEFIPKTLLNEKNATYIENNQYYVNHTSKGQKGNASLSMNTDDAKAFLNSTLNMTNYNSSVVDTRNGQTYSNKSTRNG